ncbi:MAG: protein-L-isoaspartate(D-aspartate) O-methyltransferase [Rhodobacterales bacterium]|nr:protein-L-isoaspartate(D-aspartate) O-methyltransferase [Rhodobacterales bacterium]
MTPDPALEARALAALLEAIAADTRDTAAWTGRTHLAPRVLEAMGRVPRHEFVRPRDRYRAYLNQPLPIGAGQTISQPFIVALMTDLLDLDPADRVLEVGTGCGYQTAVLAHLAARVDSVEIRPELAAGAAERLAALGLDNVALHGGDGFAGWPAAAPYDAIMVTAAPLEVPPALVEQLAPGGRIVIPLGPVGGPQVLYRGRRGAAGALHGDNLLPVGFVPLVTPDDLV